jgi:hypothetical protein
MLKRALLYAVVMFILLALAISAGQWGKGTAQIEQQSGQISGWLLKQESEAAKGQGAGTVLLHRSDSLISWSNSQNIPSKRDLKALAEATGRRAVKLPSGWFMAKTSASGDGNSQTILVPMRYDIPSSPLAAPYAFPSGSGIGPNLHLEQKSANDRPVTVEGAALAWLSDSAPPVSGWVRVVALLAWALFGAVMLALLYLIGKALNVRLGAWAGTGFVSASAVALLWLNAQTSFTVSHLSSVALFQPNLLPGSPLGHSVGDWLLGAVVLLFVTAFFHQRRLLPTTNERARPNLALAALSYLLAMATLWVGVETMRILVRDSLFRFDLEYALSLGSLGFAALTGVLVLLAALFLFSHRMVASVAVQNLRPNQRFVAIGAATAVFAVCFFLFAHPSQQLLTGVLAAAIFAFGLDAMAHNEGAGFGSIMGWLVFFSLFTSVNLFQDYRQKELAQNLTYAAALASGRDTVMAEKLLPSLSSAMQADSATLGRLLKPWPFKATAAEMRDFVNRQVFQQNYLFQHYRLSAFAFDRDNQPILLNQNLGYEQVVLENWATAKTVGPKVRLARDAEGNLRYMLQVNVNRMGDPTQPASVFLFFDHKHPDLAKTFSQLFFNSPWQNLAQLDRYDFSLAHKGRLLVDRGLANRTVLGENLANGSSRAVETDSRLDAVAKSADGLTVAAVGRQTGGLIKLVYFCSIVFILAALCLFFLALLNTLTGFLPEPIRF